MSYNHTRGKILIGGLFMLSARLLAGDVSGQGVATLMLQPRYERMLITENQQYIITLRNDSSSNLLYITDAFDASGLQLFLCARKGTPISAGHSGVHPTVEKAENWKKISKMDTSELRPGQSVTWRGESMNDYWGVRLGDQTIQAQVLVGPGQWVSSQEVPVHFLPGIVDDFPKVFTYNYVLGIGTNQMWFYQGPVDDKEYIFDMGRFRICEVPKGATPKFLYEPETYSIRISFEGVNAPDVIYDQRKRRVLSPEEFSKEYCQKPPSSSKPETKEAPLAPVVSSNTVAQVASPALSSGVQDKPEPTAKAWSIGHIMALAFLLVLLGVLIYRLSIAKK